MQFISVFFVLIGVFLAVQCDPNIIKQKDERYPDNSYHFAYQTTDGQLREETGMFEDLNGSRILKVLGRFSYFGPNGQHYEVNYVSDKNGFQHQDEYLPPLGSILDDEDFGNEDAISPKLRHQLVFG